VGASSFAPLLGAQPSPPRFPSPQPEPRPGGRAHGTPAAGACAGRSAWPLLRSSAGHGRDGSNAGSLDASGRPSWLAAGGSNAGGGRGHEPSLLDKPLSSFPQLLALEAAFQTGDTQLLASAAPPVASVLLPPVVPSRVPQAVAASVLLPASVEAPRSLLPVRTSVSDTSGAAALGQSAVQLAASAAAAGVRPHPPQQPRSPSASRMLHQQKQQQQQQPEPEALAWARRNPWFGADEAMTAVAYSAHDAHVAAGGQPDGEAYFAAIEAAVAEALPDPWQAWQGVDRSGGRGAAGPQLAEEGQPRVSPRLRAPLKDATPPATEGLSAGGGSGMSAAGTVRQHLKAPGECERVALLHLGPGPLCRRAWFHVCGPLQASAHGNCSPLAGLTTGQVLAHPQLVAMSAYQHHRLPVTTWEASLALFTAKQQQQQQQQQQGCETRDSQGISPAAGHVGSAAAPAPPPGRAGLPGLAQSLPGACASRKGGGRRSAGGARHQLRTFGGGAGSSGGGGGGAGLWDARQEYAAARQAVLDDLRRAREAAERQRRAILLQFGRAVGRQWL
jgi:hypothetical protein